MATGYEQHGVLNECVTGWHFPSVSGQDLGSSKLAFLLEAIGDAEAR